VQEDGERPQLTYRRRRLSGGWQGILTRIIAVAGGLLVLAGTIAISLVVFAIALTALLVFGLYFWWKKRHVIRAIRTQMRTPPPYDNGSPSRYDNGNVIEGEVVRKEERPREP
jgi:hypothetical protein